MKWLKSTTQKTWTVDGKVIPACVTPDNSYLVLQDSDYAVISSKAVIKSLINAGGILVLSEEPAELKNSLESLQGNNAELIAKNNALTERIAQLEAANKPVDVDAIKEEAVAELKAEAVAELQEKQNTIDEQTARIKELEKALKKAEKATKSSEE